MMRTKRKKIILTGIMVLVGAFAFGLGFLHTLNERENNRHINPDIFPAFRAIEQSCLQESSPNQTVRCPQVLRRENECHDRSIQNVEPCSAEEYYNFLTWLEFRLPPFYEPGYTPKRWWEL